MYRIPYFRGQMITPRCFWPTVNIPDITDMVNGMVFTPIPAGRYEFKSIGIVADPGGGKTQLAIYLAKYGFDVYGPEDTNIVYGRDVNECLDRVDGKRVQIVIVDDASGAQNSRKAYENIEAVQNVLTGRHIHRSKQAGTNEDAGGILFVIWVWQYFTTLERTFRKVHYAFLKTYEDETHGDYKRLIGGYGNALRDNTLRIRKGDQEAKNYTLCSVPAMFMDGNRYIGRGIYRSQLVIDFPEFPDTSIVVKKPRDPVAEAFKDVDRGRLFKAREIAYLLSKGTTQAEAGKVWEMTQGEVSKLMAWYRKVGGLTDAIA